MRRNLRAATWLMALGGTAACTSILGDFDSGNGVAPGTDAGTDGQTSNDGSIAKDGGADAGDSAIDAPEIDAGEDAAALVLKCDGFKLSSPIVVDTFANAAVNQRTLSDRPEIISVSQDVVRIVLRRQGGPAATVYTIDKNNNQNGTGSFDLSQNINPNEFRKTTQGAGLLTTSYLPGTPNSGLDLYTLPDTMPPTGPLPAPYNLVKAGEVPSSNNFQGGFFEITPGSDVFFAVTFLPQTPNANYTLQVGRARGAAGTLSEVATSKNQIGNLAMLHVGTTMRIYSSGDPSQGGAVAYTVRDDAVTGAAVTPRDLSQSASIPALLMDAAPSVGGGYNHAFIEVDTTSTTALATFRVGTVDPSKIDTFKANDLPLGPIINDAALLPVDQGSAAWYGDDFVAIGKGGTATNPGFNWIWIDANGHLRAENVGTDSILTSRSVPGVTVGKSNVSPAQKIGVKFQSWNVVWSETTKVDGGNDFDIVYLNELICH